MHKITNCSTTYVAVGNVNLAPGKVMMVPAITESLRYLESKGGLRIAPSEKQKPALIASSYGYKAKEKK